MLCVYNKEVSYIYIELALGAINQVSLYNFLSEFTSATAVGHKANVNIVACPFIASCTLLQLT